MNFKVFTKNGTCCYFDDIIKSENSAINKILKDEKSHKNILIHKISYKSVSTSF